MSANRKIWKDVIASPEILENYKEAIEKLRAGESHSDIDLKIKSHPRVYGIRTDKKGRLLFTTITVDGVAYVYILEAMLDHNYDTAKSMQKNGVLGILNSREAKKNVENYFKSLEKSESAVQTNNNSNNKSNNKKNSNKNNNKNKQPKKTYTLDYIELDYFDGKWLELNQMQREILHMPKPVVCFGLPGTGKSTEALAMIAKAVEEGVKPIYITQSLTLKNDMQGYWNNSPYSKDVPDDAVIFATYEELLQKAYPEKTMSTKEDCLEWIKKHIANEKITNKNAFKELQSSLLKLDDIYLEFRIASGYTEEEYLDLGERKCLFNDKQVKKWIWKAYNLCADKVFHPAFVPLPASDYLVGFADEGQDFTPLQLKSICQYVKSMNVCVFYDENQSLQDPISKIPFLKKLMSDYVHREIEPVELTQSYRSAPAVITVANRELHLMNFFDGGCVNGQQKLIIGLADDERVGCVQWVEPTNENIAHMKERTSSQTCVVITLKEFIQEAKKTFGEYALVFNIENTKGLQFQEVILYRLFDGKEQEAMLKDANNVLSKQTTGLTIKASKANRGTRTNLYWKNLFTSTTRAMDAVYFVGNKRKPIMCIADFLLEGIVKTDIKAREIMQYSESESIALSVRLENDGYIEQSNQVKVKPKKKNTNSVNKVNNTNKANNTNSFLQKQLIESTHNPSANSKNRPEFSPIEFLDNFNVERLQSLLHDPFAWEYLVGINFQLPNKDDQTNLLEELIDNEMTRNALFDYFCKKSLKNNPVIFNMLTGKNDNYVAYGTSEDGLRYGIVTEIDLLVTLFCYAMKYEHLSFIKVILDKKDLSFAGKYFADWNVLQYACIYANPETFKAILLRKVADINHSDKLSFYLSPLFLAAINGKLENVKQLIAAKANIHGNDKDYIRSPLMGAACERQIEVVRELYNHGAKLPAELIGKSPDELMMTCIISAPRFLEALEKRLEDERRYPIMFYNDVSLPVTDKVKEFLANYNEKKIDEFLQQPKAMQILFYTYLNKKEEKELSLIEYILKNPQMSGIFMNYLCEPGLKTDAHILDLLPDSLAQPVFIECSTGKAPFITSTSRMYRYFMHAAISLGHYPMVKLLLDAKRFNPCLEENQWDKCNILHIAVKQSHPDIVYFILKNGLLDINAVDDRGQTPLHYAATMGDDLMVAMLIIAGADIHSGNGYTPIMAAIQKNHHGTAALLLACGADLPKEIEFTSIELSCAQKGYLFCITKKGSVDIAQTEKDCPWQTPLYLTAMTGGSVLPLLLAGANIDGNDRDFIHTPLNIALHNRNYYLVKLLIECGATISNQFNANSFVELMHKAVNIENILDYLTSKHEEEIKNQKKSTLKDRKKYLIDFLKPEYFNEKKLDELCRLDSGWYLLTRVKFQPYGKKHITFLLNELLNDSLYTNIFLNYLCKNIFDILPKNLNDYLIPESFNVERNLTGLDLIYSITWSAIKSGHLEFVKLILDKKEINFEKQYLGEDRYNLLQYASIFPNSAIIAEILKRNLVDIDDSGGLSSYATPLYLAAQSGGLENVIQLLTAGAKVDGNDESYIRTPLMAAIKANQLLVIEELLSRNAKTPKILKDKDNDYLIQACGKQADFIGFLELQHDASKKYPIEYSGDDILPPSKEVHDLLNNFDAINLEAFMQKDNALHLLFALDMTCIEDGVRKEVKLLELILKDGNWCLIFFDYLCKINSNGCANIFNLLPFNPDDIVLIVKQKNIPNETIVHARWFYAFLMFEAITCGHYLFVRLLLESKRFDPSLPDNHRNNKNILHQAIMANELMVVYSILQLNLFDINKPDDSGKTLLYSAAEAECESVGLLVLAGADINGDDKRYIDTPLIAAAHKGHYKVMELLVDCGAKLPICVNSFEELVELRKNQLDLVGYLATLDVASPVEHVLIAPDELILPKLVHKFPINYDESGNDRKIIKIQNNLMHIFSEKKLHKFLQHPQALKALICNYVPKSGEAGSFILHLAMASECKNIFYDYLCRRGPDRKANVFALFPDDLDQQILFGSNKSMPNYSIVSTGRMLLQSLINAAILVRHHRFIDCILESDKVSSYDIFKYVISKNKNMTYHFLHNKKIDVNVSDSVNAYETPLYYAASQGSLAVAPLLLGGANINGNDRHYNNTPLMIAMKNKHYDIAEFLFEHGAKTPKAFNVKCFSELVEKCKDVPDVINYAEKWNSGLTLFSSPSSASRVNVSPQATMRQNIK